MVFSNGWIADDDGRVFIYYGSSDTRMHVAVSTVDQLLDYVMHTPADDGRSAATVNTLATRAYHYLQHSLHAWAFIKQYILDKKEGEWYRGVTAGLEIMPQQDKAGFLEMPLP